MILDLVRPAPDSIGGDQENVPAADLFKCLSTFTLDDLKAWFNHQRSPQQQRIRAAILHAAENPDFLEADAPNAHKSFQACCAVIRDALALSAANPA
jgi:hypothetical protein